MTDLNIESPTFATPATAANVEAATAAHLMVVVDGALRPMTKAESRAYFQTGVVPNSLYDANSVLVADSDNVPRVQTMAASTVLGRKASGSITAMTGAETGALIRLDEHAAPTDVTTLNASTSAHGLLAKLSGTATQYLDGTGAWTVPAGGGGGSVTLPGIIQMDNYAGATDDLKLTAALTAAQSYGSPVRIPAVQLPARDVTFTTSGRVPFHGMKIIGPFGNGGPKTPEISQTYQNHRVTVNVGTGTSSWWNGDGLGGDPHSIYFSGLNMYCSNAASQFWNQQTYTLYPASFDNLTFYGFSSIFGNNTQKCLMTQVNFTGHWSVQAPQNCQFNIGGSDNSFWVSGYCNAGFAGTGAGKYSAKFDALSNTTIGYYYSTTVDGWRGPLLSGNSGLACTWLNPVFEGNNTSTDPAEYPVIEITGGQWLFLGGHYGKLDSTINSPNGVIIQSGGRIVMVQPGYTRANATAATFPFLYQTAGNATLIQPVCLNTSEFVRVRWSDTTTVTATTTNQLL